MRTRSSRAIHDDWCSSVGVTFDLNGGPYGLMEELKKLGMSDEDAVRVSDWLNRGGLKPEVLTREVNG